MLMFSPAHWFMLSLNFPFLLLTSISTSYVSMMVSFKILPRKKRNEIWLTKYGFQKKNMEEREILVTKKQDDLRAI